MFTKQNKRKLNRRKEELKYDLVGERVLLHFVVYGPNLKFLLLE